jgi:transketolase
LGAIYNAIAEGRREKNKPTLIRLSTTIGYGSKLQGTHGVHGSREFLVCHLGFECLNIFAALKADDIASLKKNVGFNPDTTFHVPNEVHSAWEVVGNRGSRLEAQWDSLLSSYAKAYPNEHAELTRRISGNLPEGWEKRLPVYKATDPAQASRKLSEIVLTAVTPALPELLGGSADLTGSNLTRVKGNVDFQHESTGLGSYKGSYIRYGVREHAMGAIANGIAAYGGIIPFAGTFLNFVSYAAGAVRLSALSKHQVIWVGACIFV